MVYTFFDKNSALDGSIEYVKWTISWRIVQANYKII